MAWISMSTFQVGQVVAGGQLPHVCVHRDGLRLIQSKEAHTGCHLCTEADYARDHGVL